ncbi:hypothetical protein [Fluviicola sp.]|uniref:hypothetical protein n=1 Tax=Fluviicola sp. TaxID=1917219 RepID=UPI0031DBE1A6
MKIGVIRYRRYEERVLLNEHFVMDDLFRIIMNDADFMWFSIIDEKEKILLSTWFPDTESGALFVKVAPAPVRETEILGTEYDAYRNPQYRYRKKVTWKVGSYTFSHKRKAVGYVFQTNRRARHIINFFLERENRNESNR